MKLADLSHLHPDAARDLIRLAERYLTDGDAEYGDFMGAVDDVLQQMRDQIEAVFTAHPELDDELAAELEATPPRTHSTH